MQPLKKPDVIVPLNFHTPGPDHVEQIDQCTGSTIATLRIVYQWERAEPDKQLTFKTSGY